jgi:DNA polymerase I-like protein with 3'-5' exonuclease and polymerase domains
VKLPAFTPDSTWNAPKLSELPSWRLARRVAVDLETCDPTLTKLGPGVRTNGRVVGIAFAIEDGPSFYLPIGHYEDEANLDPSAVWRYLKQQAADFSGEIVGANLQYDMDYLAENGVLFSGVYRDVQVAEPLIDELQDSYSLDNIARRYGLPGKDERLLRRFASAWGVNPKKGLWQLPSRAVGAYAEQDVRLPLQLLRMQERRIVDQDLERIYDTECHLQKVLLKMKRRGVRVDFDRLAQIERLSVEKEMIALKEITRLTGVSLGMYQDAGKTKSEITLKTKLVEIMSVIGVPVPVTDAGNDSITNDWLMALEHPVADVIREAKKWNKLRTTFVASIHTHSVGDRIHCTFNQMIGEDDSGEDVDGARFGRLSCKNPNLQQQPARDPEIGPLWRSIYIPDEGGQWACLDYSQQEPRWLVHYAELCGLEKSKEAADAYRNDPNTDNHQMMADLCGVPRKAAKELFLGKIYGMGGGKLARKLGLPTEKHIHSKTKYEYDAAGKEAQAIINQFNEGVPFVRELDEKAKKAAEAKGYIVTAGGRRCRFPSTGRGRYDWTHKALNRLIQGSAGDQTKIAMVAADRERIRLQLQVHDELDLTIWDRSEAERLADVMRNCMPCRVPAKVDIEVGPNWGEIS